MNEILKSRVSEAPTGPGIYQMLDEHKQILYIGKAKNLRKRLTSYLKPDLTTRISRMVFQTKYLEYVVTESEAGALLLEAQLIKKFQPKFNILLKDDKSFPYIKLRLDHAFPQVVKYRKIKQDKYKGKIFGPFASGLVVNNTIDEIQKVFKLRNCSDSYFASRLRPCLQYQIKRCPAPCVGKISKEEYGELVDQTEKFLSGKTQILQEQLAKKMEELSNEQKYEEAAQMRDRIRALTYMQSKSGITHTANVPDCDVIVIARNDDNCCVQVFLYRASQAYGSRAFFPAHTAGVETGEVLESFLGQFYQTRVSPKEILLNHNINNSELICEALKKLHNVKTTIALPQRGEKLKLIQIAYENALISLEQHIKNSVKNHLIFEKLQELFNISEPIERIEIYDNSHIMGSFAVGAMVVAGPAGFEKKEYRIYNVPILHPATILHPVPICHPSTLTCHPREGGDPEKLQEDSDSRLRGNDIKRNANDTIATYKGDDYAMLRAVLTRRLERLKKEPAKKPSLVIIDGGKGHLSVAEKVMQDTDIRFICMSKGSDRHAGREQFHIPGREVFSLDKHDPVMRYLQILRDEAHNFAIKRHRRNRSNAIKISSLDNIPGIGHTRKKALLNYFGDFKAISSASIEELTKASGISKSIAKAIYEALR